MVFLHFEAQQTGMIMNNSTINVIIVKNQIQWSPFKLNSFINKNPVNLKYCHLLSSIWTYLISMSTFLKWWSLYCEHLIEDWGCLIWKGSTVPLKWCLPNGWHCKLVSFPSIMSRNYFGDLLYFAFLSSISVFMINSQNVSVLVCW